MKRKTQKEVVVQFNKDRIDFTTQQLIRYTKVYHKCTFEEAIRKIRENLTVVFEKEKTKKPEGEVTTP